MSSRASQWPCPQPSTTASTTWRLEKRTTAYGHRRRAEAAQNAPRRQTPRAARGPELFQLFEEELSGARPPPLVDVRPQGRVQRHTVEHIVDVLSFEVLDVPVPQGGDQPVEAFRHLDLPIPEQVIEVPKISSSSRRSGNRRSRMFLDPQTAEHLVEVPTILSLCSSSVVVGGWWRSSRFSPGTEYNSAGFTADR